MGYDNPQRGSAGTVVGIVAVIVVLLLGGLVVLGVGALFFLRTSARQTEVVARMEAKRAVVELEHAEKLAARVEVRESTKPELRQASTRELTIEVDRDGAITVDDESMDLDGLRARLQKDGENGGVRLAVQLKADPRCLAQHVVAVHSICSELGVEDVHISILDEPSSAITDEDASTTEAAESPSQ
jgi:biopolymer transport protein ExbD